MIKSVFFDFDGTIADTFTFSAYLVKKNADKYPYLENFDFDKLDYYRSLTTIEFLKELKIPVFKLPQLAIWFRKEMKDNIENLKIVQGLEAVLFILAKKYSLGILTSNSVENVNSFLLRHKIKDLFCCVFSEKHIFGKHISLKRILKKFGLQRQEVIYVGDEARDIQAAKKVGIKIISVAWGFNSSELLQKYSPDFIVSEPQELIDVL